MNVVIAKYIFDNTIEDVIPTFNDEFEYDFIDVVEGNITTRCINGYNDKLYNISFRDSMGLLEVEYINTKGFESLNSMFRNCKNLEKINLSGFNTENVIDFNSMFYLCKNLSEVNMTGLDPEIINKYIEWLPNRKSPMGGIIIVDDNTDINIDAANDKSWEIANSIIVKYVFDSNIEEDVNPNVDAANTAKLIFLNKKDNIYTKALVLCGEEAVAPTLLDFANSKGLIEIKKIECNGLLQLTDMFFKCSNLTKVRFDSGGYTFSDATNMFYGCESLTELDFSKFETHYNVTTARNMFAGCTNLKNVTGLLQIFYSDLEDASYMFKDCVSLTSIDMNFIYIYYETMGMFEGCTNLVEIKNFNYIQDVLIAVNMFKDCKSLTDISFTCQFNEETIATNMFAGCDKLERVHLDKVDSFTANRIIEVLPVVEENSHHVLVTGANIIDEEAAAAKNWENRCYYLYNIVITEPDNSPTLTFDTTSEHNQLIKYKTISDNTYESVCYADVLPTRYQFTDLSTKLLSLSYINTSNVTDMSTMFTGCNKLTSLDLSSFDTSNVTDMSSMFTGCNKLTSLDLSSFDTSNVTDMEYMFNNCDNLTSLDLSNFNTSNVTTMYGMFYGCSNLTSLNLSNFNTSNVTDMCSMFYYCTNLTSLDLSSFDTSKVTNMNYMFSNCSNLISVGDLSNWKDTNVKTCQYMFQSCYKIISVNLSSFTYQNQYEAYGMFTNCYELESVKLNNFRWTNASGNHFSGCSKLREVDAANMSTNSLEYLINLLPSRTVNSPGIIRTGNYSYTEENYNAANAKNWIIEPNADVNDLKRTIARYTFNSDTDTLPTFNDGYTNTEIDLGTVYAEETINIGVISPNAKILIFVDGYERILENGTVYDNYIRYIPTLGLEFYHYIDGTESRIKTSVEPTFNDGASIQITIEKIAYTDVDNGDGTITRTITSDSLPSKVSFNGESGLVSLSYLDTSNVTDMIYMFRKCTNLTSLNLNSFDTSNVTDMSYMFYDCTNLTSLDLSNFNTSNVTNMSNMFHYCYNLTSLDLSNFDTSKVYNMGYMFYGCNSLTSLDLSNFNTSNVTDMSWMFHSCYNLASIDLSNFNTSKVTNMKDMFSYCKALTSLDLSSFNTSNVTNMSSMLFSCNNLTSVDMDDSDVDSINDIIEVLPTLSSPNYGILRIGKTDMTDVDTTTANDNLWFINGLKIAEYEFSTDFDPTFNEGFEYTAITNNNNKAIISNGIRPSDISFENKTGLVSLSYLDTSELTLMDNLFYNCTNLTSVDLNSVDTSKITHMYSLFSNCNSLITIDVNSFDTSNVIDMGGVFANCKQLERIEGLNNWNTSKVTTINYMFQQCSKLLSLDLSNWDTSKVNSLTNMFFDCAALTTIEGLNNWDTSNISTMNYTFYNCNSLTSLDLSGWDTSKVNNMNTMFSNCSSLTSLDLSSFNTSNVTNMGYMFSNCSELNSLSIRNFDVNKVTNITNIFNNSNNIKIIRLDNSDMNTINTIISLLPTRNSIGKLYITNVNDVSGIDKATAASKKWKIVVKEKRMNTFVPINLGNKSIRAIYTNNESYL